MGLLSCFTDGSADNLSRLAGGYAFVIHHRVKQYQDAGSLKDVTSNAAELIAIIKCVEFAIRHNLLEGYDGLEINSDSSYCVKGATLWMKGWKERGWQKKPLGRLPTSANLDIANLELWQELDRLMQKVPIKFTHVRGHQGQESNELCDKLAKNAAKKGAVSV